VTGSFEISPAAKSTLTFALASVGDLGRLQPDVLPIKTIFMLATGCMPLGGERFFSLAENSLENDVGSQKEMIVISRETRPMDPRRRPNSSQHDMRADAYQFIPANEREPGLAEMARPFGADKEDVQILGRVRCTGSFASMTT